VTRGESFMAGRDLYPSPLVLEAMLQAGGALLRSESGFKRMTVLGKVERAEFFAQAKPGDRIDLDVSSSLSRPEGKLCEGTASVDGTVLARAEFMILYVPEDMEPEQDPARDERARLLRRALRVPEELEAL
jgi:3-hydroxyacyl-[acyl-carrier-protein] dehydratase